VASECPLRSQDAAGPSRALHTQLEKSNGHPHVRWMSVGLDAPRGRMPASASASSASAMGEPNI
jgi:hypothetical protein